MVRRVPVKMLAAGYMGSNEQLQMEEMITQKFQQKYFNPRSEDRSVGLSTHTNIVYLKAMEMRQGKCDGDMGWVMHARKVPGMGWAKGMREVWPSVKPGCTRTQTAARVPGSEAHPQTAARILGPGDLDLQSCIAELFCLIIILCGPVVSSPPLWPGHLCAVSPLPSPKLYI